MRRSPTVCDWHFAGFAGAPLAECHEERGRARRREWQEAKWITARAASGVPGRGVRGFPAGAVLVCLVLGKQAA